MPLRAENIRSFSQATVDMNLLASYTIKLIDWLKQEGGIFCMLTLGIWKYMYPESKMLKWTIPNDKLLWVFGN